MNPVSHAPHLTWPPAVVAAEHRRRWWSSPDPHATCWTKVSTKEARRRRRDRCGRLGGRSGRHPRHRARPPPLPRRPRQRAVRVPPLARRRARPGPARTAARAGAPQIHQVLLLDLQWGANCRPARRDARRGGGR